MSRTVSILNVGVMRYKTALKLQETLVNRIKSEKCTSTLILVEHPPVYTTGVRNKEYSAAEEQMLVKLGADFVRTNRGGLITFHGPGQLVAYPILNLREFVPESGRRKALLGMKWYVNMLEQMVIDLLQDQWKLSGTRSPHTGVWLGNNKVCAVGVHNSDLVTSHGIGLNCTTDMDWFRHIVPCGIQGAGVTSIKEQGVKEAGVDKVAPRLVDQFSKSFDCQTEPANKDLLDLVQQLL